MKKLIRDRMVFMLPYPKGKHVRLCENEREYEALLIEKAKEEFGEFLESIRENKDPGHMVGEAGDLIEVMSILVDRHASCDLALVLNEMKTKRAIRGGFDAGIVLEDDE